MLYYGLEPYSELKKHLNCSVLTVMESAAPYLSSLQLSAINWQMS